MSKFTIVFKKKYVLVCLYNNTFLKHYYVKKKKIIYNMFLTFHLLRKFGFFNTTYFFK